MREFWIYTLMRAFLFLGTFGVLFGVWAAVAKSVPLLWVVILAFVLSGIGSYFLLGRQREAFARKVDARAQKASNRIGRAQSKEDVD